MAQERPESAYAEAKHFVRRYGAAILVLLVAALFLWRVRAQLPPFIVAVVLTILLDPAVRWLERRGIRRSRSAAIVVAVPLVIIGGLAVFVAWLAASQVSQLVQDIDRYRAQFSDFGAELVKSWTQLVGSLRLPASVAGRISEFGPWLSSQISSVGSYVMGLVSKVVWLAIIPIATFYLLADGPRAREKILSCLSEQKRDLAIDLARQIGWVFANYVRGVITVSLLYGAVMAILFLVLGLQYAVVMGAVAALLYIFPYVGPFATFLVAVALALVGREHSWAGWWSTVVVGACVILSNAFFDNYVYPRIVGGRVKLHVLIAIFAMVSGYALMGIAGMILAVPVAASIQVVVLYLFPALAGPAAVEARAAPAAVPAEVPVSSGDRPDRPPRSGRPRRRRGPRRRPGDGRPRQPPTDRNRRDSGGGSPS
jgi:predicted PurR-regulated permease PerM